MGALIYSLLEMIHFTKTSLDRRDLKASRLVASIKFDGNEFFANCD